MRLAALLVVATLLAGLYTARPPDVAAETTTVLDGQLVVISSAVALSAEGQRTGPELSLLLDVDGELVAVVVDGATVVESADGEPLAATALHAGDYLRVDGTSAADRWWAVRVVQLAHGR